MKILTADNEVTTLSETATTKNAIGRVFSGSQRLTIFLPQLLSRIAKIFPRLG